MHILHFSQEKKIVTAVLAMALVASVMPSKLIHNQMNGFWMITGATFFADETAIKCGQFKLKEEANESCPERPRQNTY